MLEAEGPVRVYDGDEFLGLVDDEDILRWSSRRRRASSDHRHRASTDADGARRGAPRRPPRRPGRSQARKWWILGILVVWIGGWALFKGQATLDPRGRRHDRVPPLAQRDQETTWTAPATTSFFLNYVIGGISTALDSIVEFLRELLSMPAFPRPVPEIGWLGVVGLLTWLAYALAALRGAVLMAVSLLLFGFLGYWEDSMDTLIITFVAVAICVVIGIPVGIWMARSKVATGVLTPVLDMMQTMPSFAYLTPLALLFGIGPASAVVVTLVYAIPPLIRITAHGVRSVSPGTVEAARSIGVTRGQLLRKVQLPMARRTIVVGINQCTMAALSMATIAALRRRSGSRPAGDQGAAEARRRLRFGQRPRDRDHGDHARPDHDRRERAQRGAAAQGQGARPP